MVLVDVFLFESIFARNYFQLWRCTFVFFIGLSQLGYFIIIIFSCFCKNSGLERGVDEV